MRKNFCIVILIAIFGACVFSLADAAVPNASCPKSTLNFSKATYTLGEQITLQGGDTSGSAYHICLYSPKGTLAVGLGNGHSVSTPLADATNDVGQWTGAIFVGSAQCGPTPGNCTVTATVNAAADGGDTGTGQQTADSPLPSVADSRFDTNAWKYANPLMGTIDSLVDFGTKSAQTLLGLIGTIALLFLIIAGLRYITAAGQEESIKSAKRIITGTIIGLGIALIAFSLLQTVLKMLNG